MTAAQAPHRSHGGGDEHENLITLCARCHALLHEGRLTITGRAPDKLIQVVGGVEVWRDGMRLKRLAA